MNSEELEKEAKQNTALVTLNSQILRESQREKPDNARLAELKGRLKHRRLDYEAFRVSLHAAHPEIIVQRGEATPMTAVQAAAWLQSQKAKSLAVLEYIVTDDETFLFVSVSGQLTVHRIPITRKDLIEQVNTLRDAIQRKEAGGLGASRRNEEALGKLNPLITPAAALLAKARQACIIPDDILWEVPFAALKTPNGKYLIEECAVFYAPSITALKAMTAKRQQQMRVANQLLALAPFAYAADNKQSTREVPLRGVFGALPASEREVMTVSQLYRTKPHLRESATETRVKAEASQARILHFATHGFFDPLHGMYSGLVLAQPLTLLKGSEGESVVDGFLEAREIVDLEVDADLVVLSACETGRGQLSRGEGVIGLSWAFFIAGSPSTVVSQWKVSDESTAQLMTEFYRNLKAGKSKAESLRQAQLSLLRPDPKSKTKKQKWNHPFYWSPFFLIGDWR